MSSGNYKSRKRTIADGVEVLNDHMHAPQQVYPNLAAAVVVAAVNDAATWTLGALTQIIPAGVVTDPFDLHFVMLSSITITTSYQLNFYAGAADDFVGSIAFNREGPQDGANRPLPIMTRLIAAGDRVRARLATANNNGETVGVKVFYHTY